VAYNFEKNYIDNQSKPILWTWRRTTSHCQWEGIECHKSKSISTINLSNYGLKGTLHNLSFSSFPNLIGLNIYNNSFSGSIPSKIGLLTELRVMDLDGNTLSGTIQGSIGNMTNIKNCTFQITRCLEQSHPQNNLSGSISPSIRITWSI
jgi:hypothetical protein